MNIIYIICIILLIIVTVMYFLKKQKITSQTRELCIDPITLSNYCASNLDKCKPQTYVDPSTLSTYCASNLDKCKPQTYVDPKNCIINNTYKFLIEIKEGNSCYIHSLYKTVQRIN